MAPPVLVFRLSDPTFAPDVLHELSLHDGVIAQVDDVEPAVLRVSLTGDPARTWEVRATVRLFDTAVQEEST